eukprot:845008-Rhodomonas_salina.1
MVSTFQTWPTHSAAESMEVKMELTKSRSSMALSLLESAVNPEMSICTDARRTIRAFKVSIGVQYSAARNNR